MYTPNSRRICRPESGAVHSNVDRNSHLDSPLALIALVEGDVHANHILGLVEGVLHIAVAFPEALAARPPRLRENTAVSHQVRQAARVTATVVTRQACVVGVCADGHGGFDGGVFLHAGVDLADAVHAKVVVEPAVFGGRTLPTYESFHGQTKR